jgi:hypothetical protein
MAPDLNSCDQASAEKKETFILLKINRHFRFPARLEVEEY